MQGASETSMDRLRCPVCHEDVRGETGWVACARCRVRHHASCWQGTKHQPIETTSYMAAPEAILGAARAALVAVCKCANCGHTAGVGATESFDKPEAIEFMVCGFGGPGGLDHVSRRGHARMQSSGVLPSECDPEHVVALEKAGVVFGPMIEGNRIFRAVLLPDGWKVQPTNHRMYSDLLDAKGRKRAEIMYDAQDQKGWVSARRRFQTHYERVDDEDRESPCIPVIMDSNGKRLWRGSPVKYVKPEYKPGVETVYSYDVAREIAGKKLIELAPDCNKLDAYWGEDGDKIVWPEHETPPDTRATYVLSSSIYSGGSHVDSGDTSVKAKDDEEAKAKLMKTVTGYGYDEVRWSIRQGERLVDSGVHRKPRAPRPGQMIRWDGRRTMFVDEDGHGFYDDSRDFR